MRFVYFLCCLYFFTACKETAQPNHISQNTPWDTVALNYATNFTVQQKDGYTLLRIGEAWKNASPVFEYLLYPKDSTPPTTHPKAVKIGVPVERVLCSGSIDVAFLQALGAGNRIVGLSNAKYVYDTTIQARLASGQITNIGQDQGIDYEKAVATAPDLAFVYSIGKQTTYKKYEHLNIPAVMLSDFMEKTPLGRAEWLLFVSYFIGKEEVAKNYLAGVAQRYEAAKAQAAKYASNPTVLTGAVYKGTWYIAGGRSLMATFIKDAAGTYLWQDNEEVSGVPLDFEVVYAKALGADIWINQSHYTNKKMLLTAEPKYANFEAVKNNRLYNHSKRTNQQGGMDFFESAIVRPDRVLKDLIYLFHNKPVAADSLYYYMPLTASLDNANS